MKGEKTKFLFSFGAEWECENPYQPDYIRPLFPIPNLGITDFLLYEKGQKLKLLKFDIKEGETSPPKRYTSGSMILAMENAGQLIEDEELRAMIKGSGIGTSATRAEILKKLVNISYLDLNKKTQIITPTLKGELRWRNQRK